MKVQDLIAEFLYQHKTLTLPSIGRFELSNAVNVYEIKDGKFPDDAISFEQSNQAVADESFIQFLVERSGKMKALALSDLDSYIYNGLQLLNIGKPFTIKGVGSLTKSSGRLAFEMGVPFLEKSETAGNLAVKDRTRQQEEIKELDFDSQIQKGNSRTLMIVLASLIAVALIGVAVYLALPKQKNEETSSEETTGQTATTSADTTAANTVTATPVQDSITVQPVSTDTSFQLLLFAFRDSAKANRELVKQMSRRSNINMVQKDSIYRIVLTVNRPLADTAKVRDSLRLFYKLYSRVIQ